MPKPIPSLTMRNITFIFKSVVLNPLRLIIFLFVQGEVICLFGNAMSNDCPFRFVSLTTWVFIPQL